MTARDQLTLSMSGFGATKATRRVILDWFEFLGGRPGEVIYVDGGSDRASMARLVALVQEGLIDRLELLNPRHFENDFHRCYVQEYRSGMLASKPYVMFVKPDTLPFRVGRDSWLEDDVRTLDDPRVFAITLGHLIAPASSTHSGYLTHDFASLNFSLMKRESFMQSMRGEIGAFIDSDFRGDFPSHIQCEEKYRRALIEWAWQSHCRRHGLVTLSRPESREWTIFHLNKSGGKLLSLRDRYRARDGVELFFDKPFALYRPPDMGLKKLGKSIENAVRRVRKGGK